MHQSHDIVSIRRGGSLALLGLWLALTASAAGAVEECTADGKWINLNHGGMTAKLTGVVHCVRDGKTTREIPHVNGKVHGLSKRFGSLGSSDVVHTEYREGKREGVQKTFDPSGRLLSEITFAGDRESGLSRYYHANGKVRREVEVAEPDQNTLTHAYDEQGRLENITCGRQTVAQAGRGSCRYRDHTGIIETYWPNAGLRSRASFKSGLLDGVFEAFERNGTSQRREELRAGYLHGTARVLNADGRVSQEATYREGVRHGPLRVYHESGNVLEELVFDDDELMRERTFFLNGETRADTERDGNRVLARGYWDSGKLRYEATLVLPEARRVSSRPRPSASFSPFRVERDRAARYNEWGAVRVHWANNLRREGVEKLFFENGQPAAETPYRDGRRNGPARAWHENDKLAAEATYADGRLVARKDYDENGVLTRDEEYLEDGSRRRR